MKLFAALGLALLVASAPADSPVADAARDGDIDAVRALLQEGADVNAAQGDDMSALHWAAERGDAPLADMLVHAGAHLEAVTRIGSYTPLHVASRAGHAPVVARLLEAGADVAAAASNGGAMPLHLAAAAGDAEIVRLLIEHGADANAREGEWGQTPLIFAASWNRAEAIRALIEGGADPDLASETLDLQLFSELERESTRRRDELLDAFTDGGTEPPTPSELKAAIQAGREVLAKGELPEPDEDEEDDDRRDDFRGPPRITQKGGLTALLHAARQGHVEAVRALLDGGADVNRPSAADGTTSLLVATINGQFDVAMLLLERGADPNAASELNGATPLLATINSEWQPRTRYPQPQERAVQKTGYLDVMRALLEAGADPDARLTMHPWYMEYTGCGNGNCGLVDNIGATAFWRAAYATDVQAMKLLVAWGADPEIATKARPRRQRLSPDEYLRRQNLVRITEEFDDLDAAAKVEALIAVKGDLPDSVQADYPDDVIKEKPVQVREELIAHTERADSARAAEPDPSGLPPVEVGGPAVHPIHAASGVGYGEGFAGNAHRHVPDGWMAAVRYLVEHLGMDVNARDDNGYTALHHAASRGDNEMVLYLVSKGADVTVVSRRGQTTADMANGPVQRVSPFPETVALLESLGSHNNDNCLTC
ncbi:MAG: ankyrin repeat domain-containing protein [Gemmatimonadetes bacterium]|nr:ankyrin repeat domain-containing protein [Gemmatimonadota bacterium]